MNEVRKANIRQKEYLDMNEYSEVKELEKRCIEFDKTSLKLELDYRMMCAKESNGVSSQKVNEFLYYVQDQLVAYIGISCFGASTLEINGMVHPDNRRQGIFTRLFQSVKEEWINRGNPRMLLLSDGNSSSGQGFINSLKTTYEHTEYEMYYKNRVDIDDLVINVVLRKATNEDAEEIRNQNTIYFKEEQSANHENEVNLILPEDEEKRGMTILLAEVGNKIVGKVNIQVSDSIGGIYGLGVIPSHRRKGYGRQILIEAIKKLEEKACKEIMLQVSAQNKHALNLYLSCGFIEVSTMKYYQMNK
jgi:ribosomal protein S18 acetylase RimI-like enzyme